VIVGSYFDSVFARLHFEVGSAGGAGDVDVLENSTSFCQERGHRIGLGR
jgi:hypothetical protein